MIIINFKTYKESTGKNALKLAKLLKNKNVVIAAQAADLFLVSKYTRVIAQSVDNTTYGKFTGSITPESIKSIGAIGTLLNHSEKKLKLNELRELINKCKKINLLTIVCSKSLDETKKIIKFKPDYIAFEIPELISTGKAISVYEPESVKKFVNLLKNTSIKPLCGAGIASCNDIKAAYLLGTKGVLVSSAFIFNPKKFLKCL
ncbi:MAG: triose-phosphate isomerase [archaeon]